jgi:pimeloyl-ACP methyl ester carboxylesterase
MLLAATYPQRVRALVLYGTFASGLLDDDGSPGRAKWIAHMAWIRATVDHWGEGRTADWAAPSLSHNPRARTAVGALERAGMSPKMALLTFEAVLAQVDVRANPQQRPRSDARFAPQERSNPY